VLGEPLCLWTHGPILGVIGSRDTRRSVLDSSVVHIRSAVNRHILSDKYLQYILRHMFCLWILLFLLDILLFCHAMYILLVIIVSVPVGVSIALAKRLGDVISSDYNISVGGWWYLPSKVVWGC